jgi:hypothetical protein
MSIAVCPWTEIGAVVVADILSGQRDRLVLRAAACMATLTQQWTCLHVATVLLVIGLRQL